MTQWWPATLTDAMAPLAIALTEHFTIDVSQTIEFARSDGAIYQQVTDDYFDTPEDLIELENIALEVARPAVIDVGAACGRISLALQAQDVPVTALDVSPIMTDLLSARGVTDVITNDIFKLFGQDDGNDQRWSSAYFLMETIGLAGTFEGLSSLLALAHRGLADDAQIILDSAPLLETGESAEIELQIRYRTHTGPVFDWLYLDSQTLAEVADQSGWQTELGYMDDDTGHFLARLTRV